MASLSQQDLWSFIKHSKATQSASFKVLQKFVLSLNKHELIHLIETYFKSKLSIQKHDKNVSYTRATQDRLFNKENSEISLNEIDQQILSKLNRNFGNKYNKQIVAKIQQNHESKSNLLSIHPQVLAYSFQFLSYREVCKVQHVCVYFTYLNKTFPALTHYYLKFDRSLFLNIVKNRTNINFLSHFKFIELNYIYIHIDSYPWECHRKTKVEMFKFILKTIIAQSATNLETLKIDLRLHNHWDINPRTLASPAFNTLLFILNAFHNLPITKLLWITDIFKPSKHRNRYPQNASNDCNIQQIILQIQSKIITNFQRLKHFQIGIDNVKVFRNYPTVEAPHTSSLTRSVIIPMIQKYNELQSLTLDCYKWNVLSPEYGLIPLLCQMKNLKTLSITSAVMLQEQTYVNSIGNPNHCLSVTAFHLALRYGSEMNEISNATCTQKILSQLFSCFIGIQKFEFCPIIGYHPLSTGQQKLSMDWEHIFGILLRSKSRYSVNNPLNSLCFKRTHYDNAVDILQCLMSLKNESYFDLQELDLMIPRPTSTVHVQALFRNFITAYFIPFMQKYNTNTHLNTIHLSFAKRGYWARMDIGTDYLKPVLQLLNNIPKTLTLLNLSIPYQGSAVWKEKLKIKEIECTKLAKKLTQLSAEKTEQSKLESIVLNNIDISSKVKKFLMFYFGYNNKITNPVDDQYFFNFL